MTDQAPEIMTEVTRLEEKRSYRQLAVLLILVVVLTFVGLRWRTEAGCCIFLSLTLFIALFRSPPRLRRLSTLIWIILAIALVVGIFTHRRLNTSDMTTAIANNVLLRFLIGATWSRVFWSAVAGLLVGICLVWGPLLAVMYVSSEWLLAMRETFGVTRGQALRLLVSIVLNVSYPYYLIEDGEMTLVKPKGVLDLLGGPGVAVVKPYNAVVFERAGKVTRIEGPDMFMTKLFEFVKHIIDLRPQWNNFEVEEVLTKDKVPLRIKCGLGYRIESREQVTKRVQHPRELVEGRRFPGIISGEYPVYKRTIFKAAYGPAGDWKFTTKGATITQLRKIVAEYELQDIYHHDEKGKGFILAEIGTQTREKVAGIAHHWGVHVGTVNIDTIEVSEVVSGAVREQVWKMWGSEYAQRRALVEVKLDRQIDTTRAETEKLVQVTKAMAQAETIQAIAQGLKQMVGKKAKPEDFIALRFIEYLEKRCESLETRDGPPVSETQEDWGAQDRLTVMQTLSRLGMRREG
ncbi:MAG: hypothetical protein H8D43_01925 [Chloroflexi bacterium]|nr:hypothetical protein [Chloroflexota bacterium]